MKDFFNKVVEIWKCKLFSEARFAFMSGFILVFVVASFIQSVPYEIMVVVVLVYWTYKLYRMGYKKGSTTIINELKKGETDVLKSSK